MAFRTVEITNQSELHIKDSQLSISQENRTILVPLEDINHIICHGPDIRLSTMALSRLVSSGIILITLDEKYLPTAMVFPFEGNTRCSLVLKKQIEFSKNNYKKLWYQIIKTKIINQQRVLAILNKKGYEEIEKYISILNLENIDKLEALTANIYFQHYFPGLNRRETLPINSKLNYGYSILRTAIAKFIVVAGFNASLGIHHNNQYNTFNLVDDLIEPFRPILDLIAIDTEGDSIKLNKQQRSNLSRVLFSKCLINDYKSSVLFAIEQMVESLKRIIVEDSDEELKIPYVLPVETAGGITE